ncbi:M48 family metalloprotease [Novosphingobium sp. MW5]|nr:M48 family metalloprotease [Novosphingobium sp. MW5]
MCGALRAALLAALAVTGTASVPARAADPLPPYAKAYEPQTKDERGLWMEADEGERVLRDSALLVRDDALAKYVKGVLCRQVGEDRCNSARIYIVEVPQFNASMAPNGTMRVWTGLLLRARNEAELASILGHEFAHFELRHGVMGIKKARDAAGLAAWIGVIGAAGAYYGGGTSMSDAASSLQIAVIGTYFKFSRDQEAAADMLSFKYMANSPYDPHAASQVWQYIMAEADARSVARGLKPGREYKADFFGTHPATPERAAYLKAEADKLGKQGELRAKEYREALRPFMPRLLAAQVKSNDFGGSEHLLQTLSQVEGWTGDLLFARGELFRQRANPRDLATAADLFREAIAKGYTAPEVHRELGLSLLRNGQEAEGKASLKQYLALKPDASDINVIKMLAGN